MDAYHFHQLMNRVTPAPYRPMQIAYRGTDEDTGEWEQGKDLVCTGKLENVKLIKTKNSAKITFDYYDFDRNKYSDFFVIYGPHQPFNKKIVNLVALQNDKDKKGETENGK